MSSDFYVTAETVSSLEHDCSSNTTS
uniref:Uncharacterized protein n=1 Tax=Arundo donax TaxID=35708 RepID=A0A0A9A6V7_ARUDO